jgi:hypothetical protein
MAGLLVVLCFLAGFSVLTQRRVAAESERADTAPGSAPRTSTPATG